MARTSHQRTAFVITRIGQPKSPERERADDVLDSIIQPAAAKWGLKAVRSDRDPKPGQITSSIITALIQARVVIADLTGKNANVYYELAVAHSFARPVAILIDHVDELSFDTGHEKVVEIGDDGVIAVRHATKAKEELIKVLKVVLAEDYQPSNLVTEVATARRLQDLAPDDPIAARLSTIGAGIDELLSRIPVISPFEQGIFTGNLAVSAQPYSWLLRQIGPKTTRAGTLLVDTAAGP